MLKPAGEMVLLREIEEEQITKSGLLLTTNLDKYVTKAEVLAVGPGEVNKHTGKRDAVDLAEGDVVYFSGYAGEKILLDGKEVRLVREADILVKENR